MMTNRVLRRREVEEQTGLSRSSIYQGIADGWFPRPLPLGPGSVGWLDCEIDDWLAERISQRDRETSA